MTAFALPQSESEFKEWVLELVNTLTTLMVTGELLIDEILEVVGAFKDDPPALNILWDFREASMTSSFKSEFTKGIAVLAKTTVGARSDGKTAYVASSDLVFGMCRMFTSQLGLEGALHTTMVFREIDEAMKWLRADAQG